MDIDRNRISIISKYRDELFGIAIISIIIFHYCEDVLNSSATGIKYLLTYGYTFLIGSVGVEIFLFLSGMGLYFSLKKEYNVKKFYKKRLQRLLIPYCIIGGIFWFLRDIVIYEQSIVRFLYDFSLCSFWGEGVRSVWFIAFIAVMYVIYPVIFKCSVTKWKYPFFFCACAGVIGINLLMESAFPTVYKNIEIATWRTLIFLIGAMYGERIYNRDYIKMQDMFLIFAGLFAKTYAAVVKFTPIDLPNILSKRLEVAIYSLSLTAIFIGALMLIKSEKIHTFFRSTGQISLELYLTHVTIRNIFKCLNFPTCYLWRYCICILLAVITAVLLHKCISEIDKKRI